MTKVIVYFALAVVFALVLAILAQAFTIGFYVVAAIAVVALLFYYTIGTFL